MCGFYVRGRLRSKYSILLNAIEHVNGMIVSSGFLNTDTYSTRTVNGTGKKFRSELQYLFLGMGI